MNRHSAVRFFAVTVVALLLTGCATTRIADIKSNPVKYADKNVKVRGKVTTSFGVLSMGGYEIEDNTGRIYVVSNRGVPAQGADVEVEGSVFSGAMVAGQAVGVAIRESKHNVR